MNSKQQLWKTESEFSEELHKEYSAATLALVERFNRYHKYMITVTHIQPGRSISPNELFVEMSDIYQLIQDNIFPQRHKGQIPEHLRPLLLFFLDINGSKGSGSTALSELKEADGKAIKDLHAHGILFLNPDTYKQFEPELNMRFGPYIIHFQPFEEQKFSTSPGYISKMIAAAKLTYIDFCQGYLYHSKIRKSITPKELGNFSVTPQAANTNEVQCIHLETQPPKPSSPDAHSCFINTTNE